MPTYEYKCSQCNTVTEETHKMTEDVLVICDKCNEKKIRVVSGGLGLRFQGNGFYITDYKNK